MVISEEEEVPLARMQALREVSAVLAAAVGPVQEERVGPEVLEAEAVPVHREPAPPVLERGPEAEVQEEEAQGLEALFSSAQEDSLLWIVVPLLVVRSPEDLQEPAVQLQMGRALDPISLLKAEGH